MIGRGEKRETRNKEKGRGGWRDGVREIYGKRVNRKDRDGETKRNRENRTILWNIIFRIPTIQFQFEMLNITYGISVIFTDAALQTFNIK